MYFVYVIENETGRIYIGQTQDLQNRINRHNNLKLNKKNSYTSKNKGWWIYIYVEGCDSRAEAKIREKQLKTSRGRNFIKQFRLSKTIFSQNKTVGP